MVKTTWVREPRNYREALKKGVAIMCCAYTANSFSASSYERITRWAPTIKREAQAVFGISAPTPMFLGQIAQESSGDEKVTASDGGMGLAQFMPLTARDVSRRHPELGAPNPYNPKWAIRAMMRLNADNYRMVQGINECERWGAALKCYNAGCGYVTKAQRVSPDPGTWFGVTEYVPTRQSAKNFEYSRLYPRWILFKHQPRYTQYGRSVCLE